MNKPVNHANAYLRTKVMTASPAELRLLLFDGAIKFGEQSRDAITARDHEALYDAVTKCQNIVMELINTLRPELSPELCANLSALYTFIYGRLVKGSTERDTTAIDEALELLRFERETWVLLMEKLDEEQTRSAPALSGAPAGVNVAG